MTISHDAARIDRATGRASTPLARVAVATSEAR